MQKVSQLPYQRVSMEAFAQEIQGIITQVKEASSAQAVMAARDKCNQLVIRWQTAEALSYMRQFPHAFPGGGMPPLLLLYKIQSFFESQSFSFPVPSSSRKSNTWRV